MFPDESFVQSFEAALKVHTAQGGGQLCRLGVRTL